ncbi:MerR family transcriptional regulator, partial [Nocardia gipuzkoensis]
MERNSNGLVMIGDAARRVGVSVATLRYWEERGLICASARRAGVRHYDGDQLHRIGLIQLWQEVGQLSLDEIGRMLADRSGQWRAVVTERVRAIEVSPPVWLVFLRTGIGAGRTIPGMLYVLRTGDHSTATALSTMSQAIGYLIGASGPLLATVLSSVSGSWTPPL